jgi:hypothetical protein
MSATRTTAHPGVPGRAWLVTASAFLVLLAACSQGAATHRPAASPGAGPSPLVDPADIIQGAPGFDYIPAIDHPQFLAASNVHFLSPREPVIAIEVNGDARAYPVQILIWHEIVNGTVGGVPVTVTYCPLCNTGIAFRRPTVKGQLLDFGTSGQLYNSNLLMYDRETKTLWAQALGEAVVGPLTGTMLQLVPVQLVSWGDWLRANPQGEVLSRNTGFDRAYGQNPYIGYDAPGSRPFLFTGTPDPRLQPVARVVGVQVGSDIEAFPYAALSAGEVAGWAVVQAEVGGRPLAVFWEAGTASALDESDIASSRDVGSTGVFDRRLDGRLLSFHPSGTGIVDDQTGSTWDILGRAVAGPLQGQSLDRVLSIESFWFDWAAFHPDTSIYGR